ncbi:MAG: pyrimidine dimer DNA glycosylase/endonuclease V [Dehalococcoidia bacterium]|nr:pyrimidine dimer DNA glycosylase/endonuclease V [Dehalococcoidia bacterium]
MRIWDVPCVQLSRSHLLGEHRELHALWNILRRLEAGESRVGYARHPETQRWVGHGEALWRRHEEQAAEIARRGWRHLSPLEGGVDGSDEWPAVRLPGSVPPYLRED